MSGTNFEADAKRVHNIIIQLVQGEHSEQWIKKLKSKQDGRADLKALTSYYQGEGNTTRRIAKADRLRETLHYKSKRALPFGTFLHKLEQMFNMFDDNGEPYGNAVKIRTLFDEVQHPQLTSSISALKVLNNMPGEDMNYSSAANHLSAEVLTMPETL